MDPAFRKFMQHYDYFLCSPLIRATAYECFARNSIAMHIGCQERVRQREFHLTEPLYFSAAIVEVLDAILTSDPSWYVQQEAAWTFQHVLLERSPRVVLSALVQALPMANTFAVHDARALSVAAQPTEFNPVFASRGGGAGAAMTAAGTASGGGGKLRPIDAVNVATGNPMSIALTTWQRLIAKSSSHHQGVRGVLLRAWCAAFGGNQLPPAFATNANGGGGGGGGGLTLSMTTTPLLQRLYEVYDSGVRDPRRLVVRVPRFLDVAQMVGMKYVPTVDGDEASSYGNGGGRSSAGGGGGGGGARGVRRQAAQAAPAPAPVYVPPPPPPPSVPPVATAGPSQAFRLTLTGGSSSNSSKYD